MLLHRMFRLSVFALAAFQMTSAEAAQVRGVVRTPGGALLAGARVTLVNGDASLVREVRSDPTGAYLFDGVPPATWVLGASRLGRAYVEITLPVGTMDVMHDFSLGPDLHPGRWTTIGDTNPENLYASNSGSLLPDGRILYCHDTEEPVIFDPVTGAKSFPSASPSHQGCHITTLLADGRLIFIGGQGSDDFRDAVRTVKTFAHTNSSWLVLPELFEERWYPGLARLSDGRLLVMGGGQRPNAQRTATCEIYDPQANTWARTGSMSSPSDYPPAVLLRNGLVLRSWWPPQLFDPDTGVWSDTGPMVQTNRFWPGHCDHSLVLLPDGRACAIGIYRGSLSSPRMVELYDPTSGTWSLGANATATRSQPEVVMLPTGDVLVAGGKLEDPGSPVETNAYGQTRLTDIYQPAANTWRRCADMAWFREYHAVTVLVPDGRVVTTAGTGGPANPGISNDVEAFEPPYLFRGIRPRIDAISTTTLQNGSTFLMTVSRTAQVSRVVLVGTNAVTHWVDGGVPRVVSLPFTQQGSGLVLDVPADANEAPVGYYILFALVDDIPSPGVIVRIVEPGSTSTPGDLRVPFSVQVSPNPFRESMHLSWYQSRSGRVRITVYDVAGHELSRGLDFMARAGLQTVDWAEDARRLDVGPGVFWVRIQGDVGSAVTKVVCIGR